jgi:hypothetical protein
MKTLLAVSLTALMSLSIYAQSEPQKGPDWQPFAPANEEFATEVPTALKQGNVTTSPSANRNYRGRLDGTYFFIFSDRVIAPGATNVALNFARNSQPVGTPEQLGNISSEKFEFHGEDGFYHRVLTFKTNRRIYVLQTASEASDDPLAERFFAKLQIGKVQSPDNVPPDSSVPSRFETTGDGSATKSNEAGIGTGSGIGTGRGSGSESSPRTSQSTPQPTRPVPSTSLVILSKPRASYTDLAGFYGITGAIRVRVTFAADGTIGPVEAMTKLPFGLTNAAVDAAKLLRFQPAIREGQPVSVTRLVEYVFNIY